MKVKCAELPSCDGAPLTSQIGRRIGHSHEVRHDNLFRLLADSTSPSSPLLLPKHRDPTSTKETRTDRSVETCLAPPPPEERRLPVDGDKSRHQKQLGTQPSALQQWRRHERSVHPISLHQLFPHDSILLCSTSLEFPRRLGQRLQPHSSHLAQI
jgi:hypothetical protein